MVSGGMRLEKLIFPMLVLAMMFVLSGCYPGKSTSSATASIAGSNAATATATVVPRSTPASASGNMDWHQVCLEATIRAIDMEMAKYNMWLKNANGSNKEMYQKALKYLKDEKQKYEQMKPEDYKIGSAFRRIPGVTIGSYRGPLPPEPKPVVLEEAWVRGTLPGIIDYKGMSRSGPFYIVVGVKGGNLGAIKPGIHYRMKLQPIMPESYPFPSFYVCVESFEEVK